MSGFAPDWLRLREGADHRARNADLMDKLAAHCSARPEVTAVDLGAGLGSNLRATFRALPTRQHWVLVDHDPALLASACEAIAAWADTARPTASGIEATKDGRSLHVEVKCHDLAADPGAWRGTKAELVTAAALFDLVSEQWIDNFVEALAKVRLPLYAVLTHDGSTTWMPAHPADASMQAAFEHHFAGDKGFGPSVGGIASRLLTERLVGAGYQVERAASPWRLGTADRALIAALAQGWTEAVRETGAVPDAEIRSWLAARTSDGVACTVGHEDLLALPG